MSALSALLDRFRAKSRTEREKGGYFEELVLAYFRHEPTYRDLYEEVLPFREWAKERGWDATDTGIDLVAITRGTGEHHAIQCKLYAPDYRLQKADIDSFFTASGKKPFSHRIIVSTTARWSKNAEAALVDQQPPVTRIDLHDLEASPIDWARFEAGEAPALRQKKKLRPHQEKALQAVVAGLSESDRGKLIMACGTGKTFTSLKIAEELAGKDKRVLFLVPSLALLSQTLSEWSQESETPLHCFAVCSDSAVGKRRQGSNEDRVELFVHELRYPATTDSERLAEEMEKRHDAEHMSVVFSTYHSIEVLSRAQKEHGLPPFDLIICDEAHRTTGATFEGEDESHFVKVHDDDFLAGRKRLYMTATPRIYGEAARARAESGSVTLCSMDDPALYGDELHVLSFSEAVRQDLLVDYKVIVLAVEEGAINRRLQHLLKDDDNQLKVDDAARIVGCWKALAKIQLTGELPGDEAPMQRAVAFCQVIEPRGGKTHRVASKTIAEMFQSVVEAYQQSEELPEEERMAQLLRCEAQHVDGSMNASEKEARLAWLKEDIPEDTCRILSNVRCLSEGVDVPALDAVLFLSPRNSQVDVVQSVGRVMRKAPGKKRGYVILPVVIPAGVPAHVALDDNQTYRVVWQVLQALRSHDDRFDAMINKLDLIGKDASKMEVVAITDSIQPKGAGTEQGAGSGSLLLAGEAEAPYRARQEVIPFEVSDLERAIYAKLVEKVGNRHHWEDWAKDIAKIANTHIDRIRALLEDESNTREREAFERFAAELRDDLNDSISDDEIVEMLAQHLITKPVFDALFAGSSFASQNPISRAMEEVLELLQEQHLEKEADTLEGFYESVRMRAEGIESAQAKQRIVVELYDKFFRNAFPAMADRLGIVYTPVEVVDFILHSVAYVLREEFGLSLGSKGVHILDPFTGTGTFITRLLQSGLISKEELPYKYKNEIHANEIVLLAYYIAAINIEAVYHDIVGGEYQPFEGICLTDTFQMYEKEDLIQALLEDNSKRRKRQKKLDIRVIVGNPPYSVGQGSANENNQNVSYPQLDERIRGTYAARSTATNKNALYDSYIRAIRWASDRVGDSGVIGFVTNASFIEANVADGLRKCLAEEFSSIYVLHLRGNARTSGERRRKEKDNVFGVGSRAPVAISILIKNPRTAQHGKIYFHDIGDYLSREEKLERIAAFRSTEAISEGTDWVEIRPNEHGDWLRQRDESASRFIAMGSKRSNQNHQLFASYSRGVGTYRDAWCFNSSKASAGRNVERMVDFYCSEVERFGAAHEHLSVAERRRRLRSFVNTDGTRISWTHGLFEALIAGRRISYRANRLVPSLYRPFSRQWLYFDQELNERTYQMPRIFPCNMSENIVIGVSASESRGGWSVLVTDVVPSLHAVDMVGSQFFPLYLYEEEKDEKAVDQLDAFAAESAGGWRRRDGITDEGLAHFREAYPGEVITKEDLFYYVYGLLHSPEYRERFADNLGRELPRIPRVATAEDFWTFSKAGRELAELHLYYDEFEMFPAEIVGETPDMPPEAYRVEKMRFGGRGREKDRTTIRYNDRITVKGIPLEAYEYVVNGKSAIEWVMERQGVRVDKASGIVNDANDWAIETMNNPRYPLELLLRVITISLDTVQIVKELPPLRILGEQSKVQRSA